MPARHVDAGSNVRWSRMLALAALGFGAMSGCQSSDNHAPRPSVPLTTAGASAEGSLSLNLTVGGGFRFGMVAYDIGGNGFHKVGSVDASGSSTLSTVIGGIPIGGGYLLGVTAQDEDKKLLPCAGSASFDVTSNATVPVPVHLICHEVAKVVPSVPVPPWLRFVIAALLVLAGVSLLRTRRAA